MRRRRTVRRRAAATRRGGGGRAAVLRLAALIAVLCSFSSTPASASSSSSIVPLFATTNVARSAFSDCVSWRAERSSTAWWPRAPARWARTSSSATTAIVAS